MGPNVRTGQRREPRQAQGFRSRAGNCWVICGCVTIEAILQVKRRNGLKCLHPLAGEPRDGISTGDLLDRIERG